MRILLVEDDIALGDSISAYLMQEGTQCTRAKTFMNAEDSIISDLFDVILVDITLPGGNGLDLIRSIKKQQSQTGILIISAKNSLEDKLTGLDIGADDYLTKPFHMAELNARIKALVRRRTLGGKATIEFNEISINPTEATVEIMGIPIDLTKKEFELLVFFINNKNRVLTKDAIVNHLWGDNADSTATYDFIYTHIKNLRKKLTEKGCPDYLKSIYGMGYKFSEK